MKIALIQLNPVIGDFTSNTANILAWTEKAKALGCNLAVFPELAVSGYPPQDLLERPAFLRDQDRAVARLMAATSGIGVICGLITRHTASTGKPLHNSAVLFEDGRVLYNAHKRLLPTYDVFDESRYFEPASESGIFSYKGINLALTICEDIWNDKNIFAHQLYTIDPAHELLGNDGGKADLIINIAASPFNIGKAKIKRDIFANLCTKYRLPLLYVNQVGGQDCLVFDGDSLAMDSSGRVVLRADKFKEGMIIFDTEAEKQTDRENADITETEADEPISVYQALVLGIRDYVGKCGFKQVVLGLSGGVDSALTAAIASEALGPENVLGVALPSPYTSRESIEDARALAENLGIRFELLPITELFESYLRNLEPFFTGMKPDVTEQNIQARIRGNLLMALANKLGCLVLSTGNKSEMAVGYCTLYGDMTGGLAVISDVPKMMVYKLARHINREREIIPWRTINRAPSAELAPNQKDQDDLPPYEILDPILKAYLEENKSIAEITAMGFDHATVEDVVLRIKHNEYKRKQAPLGFKVTTKAFGFGRRYPVAERYREDS